ncbi:MAG: Uma2 family endonuclease, partial [Gemmatimonadaceae bacterium]
MPATQRTWTVDEVWALPDDGNRYEIVDGELFVTPAPTWRHGDAVGELFERLAAYVSVHRVAHVKFAPQDVIYGKHT